MSHETLNEKEIEEAQRLDAQHRERLRTAGEKELRDAELDLMLRRICGRLERGEVLDGE